jgi:hypothetical protein
VSRFDKVEFDGVTVRKETAGAIFKDAEEMQMAAANAAFAAVAAHLRDGGKGEVSAEEAFVERLRRAVNASCSCGGGEPGKCCAACDVWHAFKASGPEAVTETRTGGAE